MKFTAIAAAALIQLVNAASLVEVLTTAKESTLLSLVGTEPEILKALATFKGTVFAPTDAALAATVAAGFNATDLAALANVLSYHIAPGAGFSGANFTGAAFLTTSQGNEVKAFGSAEGVQIQSGFGTPLANVVSTLPFDGGFVHIVDQTLIPPANIVEVAKAAGLNSLLSALTSAGLAETVSKLSGVTILAPTDAAFAAVADVVKTLTPDQLKTVLLSHVVPGTVHSIDIVAAKSLPSVATSAAGSNLKVSYDGTDVLISGGANTTPAKVAIADVFADKVLVHVIDAVLIPDFKAIAAAPVSATAAKTATATATAVASATPKSGAMQIVGAASALVASFLLL
ncbi:hypothetical protein CcCBS67573_g04241 [Chytriomyces confervae]|uniref:FAS1 domain-containing protein n=1 Tax=Chytriomyces confervae TaxID=246404 RepID=A0A507FE21_9FUNG|nr:hypothetical protein CcCBS67573_g04241 [Chytriomyces confervae]